MEKVGEKVSESISENPQELSLTVKQVAQQIDESIHVVRNWMKELKNHIPTIQAENGYHYFNKSAIETILLIKKLSREQNYSLKQINYYLSTGHDPLQPARPPEDPLMKELKFIKEQLKLQEDYNQAQKAFNQALMERLEAQQKYITESLQKRDLYLLEVMRESQQAKEEVAVTKKKGFLSRFFS